MGRATLLAAPTDHSEHVTSIIAMFSGHVNHRRGSPRILTYLISTFRCGKSFLDSARFLHHCAEKGAAVDG